ncbi:hypothetical protein [Leifsonia shinshuensis]
MSDSHANYSAMTVNERLFAAGLLGLWDRAINRGDREKAIEILGQVQMDQRSASQKVDAVLTNPSKYGYPREGSEASVDTDLALRLNPHPDGDYFESLISR